MSLMTRLIHLGRLAFFEGQNRLSYLGAGLTTASTLAMGFFWMSEWLGGRPVSPYTGIIFILILPTVFMLGLFLMPLGVWLKHRRMKKDGALPKEYPPIRWDTGLAKRVLMFVGTATVANGIILTFATAKGVKFADSNAFCGTACHEVMAPEYGAFLDSPHAQVGCAKCHIAPGADGFLKAKFSGVRQLAAVTFGNYSRPVSSPVAHMPEAKETCGHCHWPERKVGDKVVVRTTFGEDEASTPSTTILLMHVDAIHGQHLKTRVAFAPADPRRLEIAKVSAGDDTYRSGESKLSPADQDKLALRTMDCMDCHNRPAHTFDPAGKALDKALQAGRIDRTLPFVKKTGMELLTKGYPSREEATKRIPADFEAHYRANAPEVYAAKKDAIQSSGQALLQLYLRNVYPELKLDWGTHPNHLGHADNTGCFRCHGGNHKSSSGKTLSDDCEACHSVLAADEPDPKLLKDLGLAK